MAWEVPLVLKDTVSIVAIGDTGLEPMALRTMLEAFNFRVDIHWVGSRKEAVEILRGSIPTFFPYIILSCHGDPTNGGCILVPDEPPLTIADLASIVHLPERVVLNLGCATGTEAFAAAFFKGGCVAYIAPADYVEGNAAIFFAIHLFYFLAQKKSLREAVELSRAHDECGLFRLYLPNGA